MKFSVEMEKGWGAVDGMGRRLVHTPLNPSDVPSGDTLTSSQRRVLGLYGYAYLPLIHSMTCVYTIRTQLNSVVAVFAPPPVAPDVL